MMSTIGRSPVMAAPTPRPVKPASEMGVSMTRSRPNSCTSPPSTLNAVPASATSSPSRTTRGSRRISSAMASLTASPNVSSRAAEAVSAGSIHVLGRLLGVRIRRIDGPLHGAIHVGSQLRVDRIERSLAGNTVLDQMAAEDGDGIALGHPVLLLLLRTVVVAADIADVMAPESIRVRQQERGAITAARARHQRRGGRIHRENVLSVDRLRLQAEPGRPPHDFTRRRLGEMGVFVIEIVLAEVHDRQLPQL